MNVLTKTYRVGTKIICIATSLLLLFAVINGVFLFFAVKKSSEETLASEAINKASLISEKINTDLYTSFLNNPVESSNYWTLRDQLNDYKEKMGALYVYTLKDENQKLSIMVDGEPKDSKDVSLIGDTITAVTHQNVYPVLQGGTSSTGILHDPGYDDFLSAFAPIKDVNGKVIGILGVDTTASKVITIGNQVLGRIIPTFLIMTFLTLVIAISMLGYFISRSISKPLRTMAVSAERMGNGDFTGDQFTFKSGDEIGDLAVSFNKMKSNIHELIENIKEGTEMMASSSEELASNAEESVRSTEHISVVVQGITAGVIKQVESISESGEALEILSMSLQQVTNSTSEVSESAQHTLNIAYNGNISVKSTISKMSTLQQTVSKLSSVIKTLGKRSHEIRNIMITIQEVSTQTNVLSLNAAIEAARAAEHGRGFAVVADEVRRLAKKSTQSVKSVDELLASIQSEMVQAVESMERVAEEVMDGILAVNGAGDAFERIQNSVDGVAHQIKQVVHSVENMVLGTSQVDKAIRSIAVVAKQSSSNTQAVSAVTQQQLASSAELASSSTVLARLAEQLTETADKFKV